MFQSMRSIFERLTILNLISNCIKCSLLWNKLSHIVQCIYFILFKSSFRGFVSHNKEQIFLIILMSFILQYESLLRFRHTHLRSTRKTESNVVSLPASLRPHSSSKPPYLSPVSLTSTEFMFADETCTKDVAAWEFHEFKLETSITK